MDWARASEAEWRANVPVFINSFEQLTYLRDSVDWFHLHGFRELVIIDQGSTHPALLDFLASEDLRRRAHVWVMNKNIGPRRAVRRCAEVVGLGTPFVFTDPDLGLPAPPHPGFMRRLYGLGRKYDVTKVGLALDVFDGDRVDQHRLLTGDLTILDIYAPLFDTPLERDVYDARTDTTFFLYVPRATPDPGDILSSQPRIPGIRVGGPGFLADHRPWLFDNGMTRAEEDWYRARTTAMSTTFGRGHALRAKARLDRTG